VDFVIDARHFVEVKRGRTSPVEFAWFARRAPKAARLTVIGRDRFAAERVDGVTFEDFLRGEPSG
jgi:hypothetical protein